MLIVAITALSVFAIERGESRREEAELSEAAQSIASAIERRGNTSSAYLRAGAALFSTVEKVPATLFRRFVSELRLDSDYRGAEGVGWAEVISPEEIDEFELRTGAEVAGMPRVHPRPERGRGQLLPVTFLQPDTARNRRALGYDMYSDPVRRAAMDEAERAMRPTASGRVILIQDNAPGFLIYMPVFDQVDGGRRLKGFIYSPFDAHDFLESAVQQSADSAMGVRL